MQPRVAETSRDQQLSQVARQLAREERARAARLRASLLAVGALLTGAVLLGVGLVGLKASQARPAPVVAGARAAAASPNTTMPGADKVSALGARPTAAAAGTAGAPQAPTEAKTTSVSNPPKTPESASPKPRAAKPPTTAKKPAAVRTQHLAIAVGAAGYEPSRIVTSAGTPIVLTVGKGQGCAAGFNIPKLGVHIDNSIRAVTQKLGRLNAGTYTYVCSMGMVSGKLIVR
jgi:hypothetical protein